MAEHSLAPVESLARFVAGLRVDGVPRTAITHAQMLLASTIGSAAAGIALEPSRIIRELGEAESGAHGARIWFTGTAPVPLATAARANAASSDAAAADDADLRTVAHLGAAVCGPAVAVGNRLGSSGADVLLAIVAGYEVAGRFAAAAGSRAGVHPAYFNAFAAAATTSRLLGATEDGLVSALALASTTAAGVRAASPTWARPYQAGAATAAGVTAALTAIRGYDVPVTVLDGPGGLFDGAPDLPALGADLGSRWGIEESLAIKLSVGGFPFAAARDAAAEAAIAAGAGLDEIERIIVAGPWLTTLPGVRHPRSFDEATHSLAFAVALSVADREHGWNGYGGDRFGDPALARLSDLVEVGESTAPVAGFGWSSAVTIVLRGGRSVTREVGPPRGSAPREIRWQDVDEKTHVLLARAGMESHHTEALLASIHSIDKSPTIADLDPVLARSLLPEGTA